MAHPSADVTVCDASGMGQVFAEVNGHEVSVMDNLTAAEADAMAENHNAELMNFRAWFSAYKVGPSDNCAP